MIINFLCAFPQVKYMISLIHDKPSISLAYIVLILLVTSCFTFAILLLLLCHYYFRCHHHFHITVATNILLPRKYLSGAVELKTQLLKFINILWLPLCPINKLGYLIRENCCDPLHLCVIKRAHNPQGDVEVGRVCYLLGSFHLQAQRAGPAFLQDHEKKGSLRMDTRGRRSL